MGHTGDFTDEHCDWGRLGGLSVKVDVREPRPVTQASALVV